MCFNKTEESKLLIAKRDITVYKVGYFADEVRFYSYFMTTYMYSRNTPMRECVDFNRDSINIGLHSLLSLQGICDSRTKDMLFFPNGNLYPFIITNVLYNHVYVGKLILMELSVMNLLKIYLLPQKFLKRMDGKKIKMVILMILII